jgi:hypothetical protein
MKPYLWHTNNTKFDSWFERDRAMVRLTDTRDQEIICLWDDEVSQFIEDGFKTSRQDWHEALAEYCTERKLTTRNVRFK